jgi:cold shock protein
MARGTVKWFNSQKGYGFIQPQDGGRDVFVHISAVERAGLPGLNEGQTVEFELVSNRGKTSAENLKAAR